MRILYLGNNWVGWQIVRWLREHGEDIVGLVVHPPDKSKYREEIIQESGLANELIFEGSQLRHSRTLEDINNLRADIGISILFGYILKPEFLSLFPRGIVNLHPSLLPYNRGQYPNVWSIIDGTPAGVTLHYIDEGVDTGDIIAQCEIPVEPVDTGESLYRKLERTSVELFKKNWREIACNCAPRVPQGDTPGTYHRTKDVEAIDEIDLDKEYRARDLINIMRARTFPPHSGAYFRSCGRKVFMRLSLFYEEYLEERTDAEPN